MSGYIEKRGTDSWTLLVSLRRNPVTGKYQQRWLSVKDTKKDAERELRTLITRLENGIDAKPGKLTVCEYLLRWLDSHSSNLSATTVKGYYSIAHYHLIPALDKLLLTQLQPMHIQSFIGKLSTKSPQQVIQHPNFESKPL